MSTTDIDKIRNQVLNMINDLSNISEISENELQIKYSYLYNISKTLFNFIYKEKKNKSISIEIFNNQLNQMLDYISKIQKKELTQNNASELVGKMLANQYIPYYQNNNIKE